MRRIGPQTIARLFLTCCVLIVACGGGESSGSGGEAEAMDRIEIVGAPTELAISEPGGCGPHAFEPGAWNAMFSSDGDEPWLLDVTIVSFEAPKVYEISAEEATGMASLFLTDGAGTTYESTDGLGGITVDRGGLSGSLDVVLTNPEDGSTVSLKGSFTCEDLS